MRLFSSPFEKDDYETIIVDSDLEVAGRSNDFSGIRKYSQQQKSYRQDDFDEFSTPNVFIVEDEESIRCAIKLYLSDRGYNVISFEDARSALNHLTLFEEEYQETSMHNTKRINDYNEHKRSRIRTNSSEKDGEEVNEMPSNRLPDAIVSDILMPGMDGIEFLNQIRTMSNTRPIPFILLTAKGMTQDRIAGYNAGADAYLPKPFDPEELVAILDNVIDKSRLSGSDDEIGCSSDDEGDVRVEDTTEKNDVYFTSDELKILEFLCKGLRNKEISLEMKYSIRWVEQKLTGMYRKTKCSNRTELVRWANLNGMM